MSPVTMHSCVCMCVKAETGAVLENGEQNAQRAPKPGKRPPIFPSIPGYTRRFTSVVIFLHSITSCPFCVFSYFAGVCIIVFA